MHIILHIILHILHIILDAYCKYCAYPGYKSHSQGFHSLLPLLLGAPTQGPAVHVPPPTTITTVVYKCWGTTLKLFFRRWLQKFQHHTPTFVNKDR